MIVMPLSQSGLSNLYIVYMQYDSYTVCIALCHVHFY